MEAVEAAAEAVDLAVAVEAAVAVKAAMVTVALAVVAAVEVTEEIVEATEETVEETVEAMEAAVVVAAAAAVAAEEVVIIVIKMAILLESALRYLSMLGFLFLKNSEVLIIFKNLLLNAVELKYCGMFYKPKNLHYCDFFFALFCKFNSSKVKSLSFDKCTQMRGFPLLTICPLLHTVSFYCISPKVNLIELQHLYSLKKSFKMYWI